MSQVRLSVTVFNILVLWLALFRAGPGLGEDRRQPLPANGHRQESLADWYIEGHSGSWLQWQQDQGFSFPERYPARQILRACVLAAATASLHRLPQALNYGASGLLTKAALLPSLALPAYYLYHHLYHHRPYYDPLQQAREQDYPIYIADQHALAERLSIRYRYSEGSQSLIFRMPPARLAGLPVDGLKASLPLPRLARLMMAANSDQLELHWPEPGSAPELRLGIIGQPATHIEVPLWAEWLRQQRKKQPLPAVLAFLQPAGLDNINQLLACLLEQPHGTGSCETGTLQVSSITSHSISNDISNSPTELRFQPRSANSIEPVHSTRVDRHAVIGLPPCTAERCAMALVWILESDDNISAPNLPQPPSPLLLYSSPLARHLPQTLPEPAPSMFYSLSPPQTDILTLLPYSATWLLTSYLLGAGMRTLGLTPELAATATGGGLLGWIGLSGIGGFRPGGFGFGGWGGYKPGTGQPAAIQQLEQAMLKQLPASTHLQQQLYTEVDNVEPGLVHQGNNCFFNATISYFNSILSERLLDDIDRDRFQAVTRLYRPQDNNNFKTRCETEHRKFRTAFTRLMRAISHSRTRSLKKSDINKLKQEFYQSARSFSNLPQAADFKATLSSRWMSGLQQEDPDELINAISTALGLDLDPERSLISGTRQSFIINDLPYGRTSWEAASGDYIRVELPSPEQLKSRGINNLDDLINRHYLARERVTEDNKYYLCPSAAAEMGVTDAKILINGAHLRPWLSPVLGHHCPERLRHLNVQVKMFRHADNQEAKIRTVTRRLLTNGRSINLPVTNLSSDGPCHIQLQLSSLIMHCGNSARSGHYVTAVRRANGWYIYDDLAPTTIRLKPKGRAGNPDLELLLSYMEQHGFDPYLLHFSK